LVNLTYGSILAGVALAGALYISFREVSRLLFIFFVILTYASLVSWRVIVRMAFRRLNGSAIQNRQVLIIGAGPVGREVQEKMNQLPYLGLRLIGFLDDDLLKQSTQLTLSDLRDVRRYCPRII
jgi:undecaprenyl-phosphate galactose phosphotransferase/putative colanic acid biosynthesis UDP-glucose lipid carrier transferase